MQLPALLKFKKTPHDLWYFDGFSRHCSLSLWQWSPKSDMDMHSVAQTPDSDALERASPHWQPDTWLDPSPDLELIKLLTYSHSWIYITVLRTVKQRVLLWGPTVGQKWMMESGQNIQCFLKLLFMFYCVINAFFLKKKRKKLNGQFPMTVIWCC